jgi:hypothetical protein
MRHFVHLVFLLLILVKPVQGKAGDEVRAQALINQLLLSQKVTTLLDEGMDANEKWHFDGSGVRTKFEDGKFSINWAVTSETAQDVPTRLLSSRPFLPSPDLDIDQLRLTVVFTAAYFYMTMIEDDFVNTGMHTLSYKNFLIIFRYAGIGIELVGTQPDDYPLVIKLHYDISSGSQTMLVNGKIRSQSFMSVETNNTSQSEYSFVTGQSFFPHMGPDVDSGFIQLDHIILEAVTD